MSFDPGLVERVRDALARLAERGTRERRVFGGYGFLQGKQTFVIVWGEGILAKLTPDEYPEALARPGIAPFAPAGERPMGTWVLVLADVVADDPELAEWVAAALRGIRAAPSKKGAITSKPTHASTVTKQSTGRSDSTARSGGARSRRRTGDR